MPRHQVERLLPYEAAQLFDLAADVARYPEFLPWWVAARVSRRTGNTYETDQVVRFGVLRVRFASRAELRRPEQVRVSSNDRLFRRFALTWTFDTNPAGGVCVSLAADVAFRSPLLEATFGAAVARLLGGIVAAFEAEAHRRFGPASPASGKAPPGPPARRG